MAKELYARKTMHKGIEAVELAAGDYYAVVAPSLGSNVLRFRDNKRKIEVFRYRDDVSISQIMGAYEIWGLPTLYLPNRFDGGVLKTSDGEYHLPVNEGRFGNHLHGFVHQRAHKIKEMKAENGAAYVTTEFVFDDKDIIYQNCFPLKFVLNITIELSKDGLKHTVSITNKSKKMLPISFATHTTVNAPFAEGAKQEDIRLQVPAVKKLQFNKKRWLPNGRQAALTDHDKEYLSGKCPVLQDICNDMYTAGTVKLDKKDFHGTVMTDTASGKMICNETDEKYKFWIVWNDKGFQGYFCPEPMTAQVNAPNLDMPEDKSGYEELAPNKTYTVWQRFFTKG